MFDPYTFLLSVTAVSVPILLTLSKKFDAQRQVNIDRANFQKVLNENLEKLLKSKSLPDKMKKHFIFLSVVSFDKKLANLALSEFEKNMRRKLTKEEKDKIQKEYNIFENSDPTMCELIRKCTISSIEVASLTATGSTQRGVNIISELFGKNKTEMTIMRFDFSKSVPNLSPDFCNA